MQSESQQDALLSVKQFCGMQALSTMQSLPHLLPQKLPRILGPALYIHLCLLFLAYIGALLTLQAAASLTSPVLPPQVCACILQIKLFSLCRVWSGYVNVPGLDLSLFVLHFLLITQMAPHDRQKCGCTKQGQRTFVVCIFCWQSSTLCIILLAGLLQLINRVL